MSFLKLRKLKYLAHGKHGKIRKSFMKCAACEQNLVKKVTELDLRVNDKLHLVKDVELEE